MIIFLVLFCIGIIWYLISTKRPMYKWNNCSNDAKILYNTFNHNGCIIIPNILSEKECNDLNNIIDAQSDDELGSINSSYNRKDKIIPLSESKIYIDFIMSKIQGFINMEFPNYKIAESSSFISYPGCYPQIWHSDTTYNSSNDANLVSFGIALNDISDSMGPLEVYLESTRLYNKNHLAKNYNITDNEENSYPEDKEGLNPNQPIEILCKKMNFKHAKCSCKKGSLIVWSSKVIHRGGSNISEKIRKIFYFSLLGKGEKPIGATYSISKYDLT